MPKFRKGSHVYNSQKLARECAEKIDNCYRAAAPKFTDKLETAKIIAAYGEAVAAPLKADIAAQENLRKSWYETSQKLEKSLAEAEAVAARFRPKSQEPPPGESMLALREYMIGRQIVVDLESRESECSCDDYNFHRCDLCEEISKHNSGLRSMLDLWADRWAVDLAMRECRPTLPVHVWCECGHVSGHHGVIFPHACAENLEGECDAFKEGSGRSYQWVPERIVDLAERLVAPGQKAAHVSASECHELRDFIIALSASRKSER